MESGSTANKVVANLILWVPVKPLNVLSTLVKVTRVNTKSPRKLLQKNKQFRGSTAVVQLAVNQLVIGSIPILGAIIEHIIVC